MEYVRFGSTGLKVSRICLGCMSYGGPTERWSWALDEERSRPFIQRALELGINFFDTANVYSDGASEEIVGKALREFASRDEVVIATKVYFEMGPGPNDRGLSRKHILSSIDASLKRLGTDYVELYQIHRWDYDTPIEETLQALNDVVRAGKARYIGASAMYAWQFAKARGLPMAQVALAWILSKPVVTAPIIGATRPHHLDDAVAAVSVQLTPDEIRHVEEAYQPHPVLGYV